MEIAIQITLLIVGVAVWYFLFGIECYLNGAMDVGHWMPFKFLWRDFKCNLPITGALHRLEWTGGDVKWALMLPGPIHFLLTHVLLPLGPWIAYILAY